MTQAPFEIFLSTAPGLEPYLLEETQELGFHEAKTAAGGVSFMGAWPDVWRANLWSRGASRVLARIGSFRAFHLAQLDKRARKFPWGDILRPGVPLRVEATCKRSKIYHDRAAAQRIERAVKETLGAPISKDATLRLMVRIEDDLCTFSLDTSGAPLHQRGFKQFVAKAPMRETMAALLLRACGYTGTEPVLDPMCGSGTFLIEAAEIAAGLAPGRARRFAFEDLASFDDAGWDAMRTKKASRDSDQKFLGFDRDTGAVKGANENAERAGVAAHVLVKHQPVSNLNRPDGPPGLVMVNPPYGARIGSKKPLYGLYASLGERLKNHFPGWRVGLVTTEPDLAKTTGLPFAPPGPPISHGGLKIKLWTTPPLL
ncbi:MAG: class I SAM-dependent RNA methyltransferase [Pseudomonadota bacterium]